MSRKYFSQNQTITFKHRFQRQNTKSMKIDDRQNVKNWTEKVKDNPTTNLWNVVPPILQAATPVLAVTYTFNCFNDFNISFSKKDFPTPAEPVIKTFLNRKTSIKKLKMTAIPHRTAFMIIVKLSKKFQKIKSRFFWCRIFNFLKIKALKLADHYQYKIQVPLQWSLPFIGKVHPHFQVSICIKSPRNVHCPHTPI